VCTYKSTGWDDDSIAPNQTLPHIYSLDRLKPYLKSDPRFGFRALFRLSTVGTQKQYRVKTATLDTLKRYSIISLTLYIE
jgi:hypothetical protein